MEDKLYLFNPFNIVNATTEMLQGEYVSIYSKVNEDTDNPFVIAQNVERYSNLYLIIGEMIARYQYEVDTLKSKIESDTALQTYKEREIWVKEHDGKAPAMSYFQAKAFEFVRENSAKLNDEKLNLRRFKNAWESTDQKINALKKMYDAKKYELGFNK
jgi:hypothetical protein